MWAVPGSRDARRSSGGALRPLLTKGAHLMSGCTNPAGPQGPRRSPGEGFTAPSSSASSNKDHPSRKPSLLNYRPRDAKGKPMGTGEPEAGSRPSPSPRGCAPRKAASAPWEPLSSCINGEKQEASSPPGPKLPPGGGPCPRPSEHLPCTGHPLPTTSPL